MGTTLLDADTDAPVYSEASVHIDAPPARVWRLMAAVAGWPSWNPEIKEASIDGPVAPGARITWRSGPGTIKSVVADVDPDSRLSWTGSTLGIKAIHVWLIQPERDGTLVTTQESWNGPVVRLMRSAGKRRLDRALASGLAFLKKAAEDADPERSG